MWGGVVCIFISLILIQFTNANDIITINNTDCKNGTHYFQCKDGKLIGREFMDIPYLRPSLAIRH